MVLCRDRISELEEVVEATGEVNRHLAVQVETLAAENDSLSCRIRSLTKEIKTLKHSQSVSSVQEERQREEEEKREEGDVQQSQDGISEELGTVKRAAAMNGWLIHKNEITIGTLLGQGTFGKTFKGVWRGGTCAVKQVELGTQDGGFEHFAREASALSAIRHPHVLSLYGAVIEPPQYCWLVTKYHEMGTLHQCIHERGRVRLNKQPYCVRLRILADIASGMASLEQHDPPIVHRDLKPSNVLLDKDYRATVSDMGLARILSPDALVSLTPETGMSFFACCIRTRKLLQKHDKQCRIPFQGATCTWPQR